MSLWRSRYTRRVLLVLAVAAMAVILRMILPQPTITIAVHQGVEGVPIKQVAARFCEEKYHGKVRVVELSYDELFSAEWSALSGERAHYPFREPPQFDVIMLDDPWLPAFVMAGGGTPKVMELDAERMAGKDGMSDFPETCRSVCQVAGKYYAVPFAGNSQLFCRVQKDVPVQPADWKAVRDLPRKDKLAYAMRLGPGNAVATDFLPILWTFAPDNLKERDDYSKLDRGRVTQALILFHELADRQHWASAVTQDVDVAVSIALNAASTGIVWNAWAMALEQRKDLIEPITGKLEYGWFDNSQPVLGAWLLAVPQNAPHPDRAKEFIEYAIDRKQLELAAEYGNPPPRLSILRDLPAQDKHSSFKAQLDYLPKARPRPRTPCWREVEGALSRAISTWRKDDSDRVVDRLLTDLKKIHGREGLPGCSAE